jgi:hypothetical protein
MDFRVDLLDVLALVGCGLLVLCILGTVLVLLLTGPTGGGRGGASRRFRIIAPPPGEAPPEVRAAWVGCVLRLFAKTGDRRLGRRHVGVLSREPVPRGQGYAVGTLDALRELERRNPTAARWWYEHTPHLLRPGHLFLFAEEACELLDGEEEERLEEGAG